MRRARGVIGIVVFTACAVPPQVREADTPACGAGLSAVTRATPRGIEAWCEDEHGVRAGPFERRFPSGQIAERSRYAAGVLDGESASFYANGSPHARGRYVHGVRDGAWRAWHENGKPWLEVTYAGGAPIGSWLEYDYTGEKMFEGAYRDGQLDGAWQRFREGAVAVTGSSAAGRLEGPVVEHSRDGTRCEVNYRNNRAHGTSTCHDKDGKLLRSTEYVDGVEQGSHAP